MFRAIVRKEIMNHLLTARCAISLAVLLAVTPAAAGILVHDQLRRLAEYDRRQADIDDYMKKYAHFNRVQNIIRPVVPPQTFTVLVRGLSDQASLDQLDNDPLPVIFPMVDLVFIVTILLSLTALIFTYDAICGEKEEGTLKLLLAGRVSRPVILWGKLLAVWLTIGASFLLALGLGMMVLLLQPRLSWSGLDWSALGLLVAGVLAFLFCFTAFGMLISALHRTSTAAMLTALCGWVVLVQVVPNLSPYLASFLVPLPSRIRIEKEIRQITDVDRDRLINQMWSRKVEELYRQYPVLQEKRTPAEHQLKMEQDPQYRQLQAVARQAHLEIVREANRVQGEKAAKVRETLDRGEARQQQLARNLSLVSPSACFTYLAGALAATGLEARAHAATAGEAWGEQFGAYMDRRIRQLMKENPQADTYEVYNSPVDMSDRPVFRYRPPDLAGRLAAAWFPFVLLAGTGLLMSLTAHFVFLRYDVR